MATQSPRFPHMPPSPVLTPAPDVAYNCNNIDFPSGGDESMPITQNGVELSVEISAKAAEKIKYFADKEGIMGDVGLRVAVKGGGCSGLTYDLTITDQERESDKIVEQYGVKVMVDKKSYIYLVGTQLDFSDGLNGKGFVFENPNAKKACGCGTSFAV